MTAHKVRQQENDSTQGGRTGECNHRRGKAGSATRRGRSTPPPKKKKGNTKGLGRQEMQTQPQPQTLDSQLNRKVDALACICPMAVRCAALRGGSSRPVKTAPGKGKWSVMWPRVWPGVSRTLISRSPNCHVSPSASATSMAGIRS